MYGQGCGVLMLLEHFRIPASASDDRTLLHGYQEERTFPPVHFSNKL